MTLPSVIIKDTLVADGYSFGTKTDWGLWIGKQPPRPDRAVTIYDAPGNAPNPRYLLDYPSVQIRVRGGQADYAVAGSKIREIRDRLLGRESYDAYDGLGDRIVHINGIGDIAFTGWDDATRPEFVLNLALIIEQSQTTSPTNREPL
jgi:hypothetical protein